MTGTLLVTPQELKSTATEFNSCMGQVKGLTDNMMELIRNTSSFWEGEAANAYKNKFNELSDDIQKIHNMINEHVEDLNEIAAEYERAEAKNQEISSALSGNVL